MQLNFMMTTPASDTKIKVNYFWSVKPEHYHVVNCVIKLQSTCYSPYLKLKNSLKSFYHESILKMAGVNVRQSAKKFYKMRSARANRATEWVMLV